MVRKNIFTETENSILLIIDGGSIPVGKDHPSFDKIKSELHKKTINWDRIKELSQIKKSLINYIGDRLKVIDNTFIYQNRHGTKIELSETNPVVAKILEGFQQERDYMPYVKFLDNILKNPRQSSRDTEIFKEIYEELFKFLEHNEIEITNDGCFLAYKKVRSDFKDIHSGTFDNSVGKIVKMKREEVELDRNITCSTGLHFCAKEYLDSYSSYYGGDVVVIVKVNPKDVISIPVDYNNAKGRCCRYEVIGVLQQQDQNLKDFIKTKKKSRKLEEKPVTKKKDNFKDKSKDKLERNLPIFHSVDEMRKLFKPRVVNAKCYVYNQKKNEYRLYQFIGGTSNSNLKCIKTFCPRD